MITYARIQKVLSEGVQLWRFLVDEVISGAIIGPLAERHLMACPWWPNTESGLVALWFFRGSGPVYDIARKPYIFVVFQGGGGPDPLPPMYPHATANSLDQIRPDFL